MLNGYLFVLITTLVYLWLPERQQVFEIYVGGLGVALLGTSWIVHQEDKSRLPLRPNVTEPETVMVEP